MKLKKSKMVIAGHIGNSLEGLAEETPVIQGCQHKTYCKGIIYPTKCNYQSGQSNCQLKKFYERYPNWRELFV
jgi:hypothetical protein